MFVLRGGREMDVSFYRRGKVDVNKFSDGVDVLSLREGEMGFPR